MVFKRREKQTRRRRIAEMLWPRGGWRRALQYLTHRVMRIPDDPRRVARGAFAGVFACFGPYIFHDYVIAIALAWLIRGNIFAALVGSLIANPVTIPFFAVAGVSLGQHLLGIGEGLPAWQILSAFGAAASEILHNCNAIFGEHEMRWVSLSRFFHRIYLPYLVGGTVIGIVAGLASYIVVLSLVRAYRGLRTARLRDRSEALRRARELRGGDDAGGGRA
ncbi:DUF2062 domain-containing protein [Cereibacter sp. SYSU M97828]|nr:DUF2062 domain-containing protein [Cereibacter flavus]